MAYQKEKIHVLYVEDNPIDIDLTLSYFENEASEFEFTIAKSAKEFYQLIKESSYDIYLLDNNLPDALGVDILEYLNDINNQVPAVMVTGVGDQEIVVKALRLGAVDYIPKDSDYYEKLKNILSKIYYEHKRDKVKKQKLFQEKIDVLYVERNQIDIDLTKNYFDHEANFINLVTATTAEEAFSILKQNKNIKVILCDLKLPGISGLDFLHELKIKGIDIPFIMITGFGDEKTALASLKLGAYDFILKSQNYLEKLPLAVVNAYHKYKFEESVIQSSEAHNHAESNEKRFQERTIELISTIEDKEKLLQDLQIRDERYRAYFENSFESISRFELLEPVEITLPLDQIIEKIYSYSVLKEYNKAFLQTHNLIPIENLNEIKIGMILPKVSSDNFNILKNFVQNNFKIQNAITKELSSDGTYKIFLTNLFGVVEENKLIRIWSTKREITDLKKAEEEIIKLNQELEKRVEERTRDLELANKELESFSYSVSHDLRAPLRAIIGYSNIIQEDYQENLIPPVKELFESIVKNAKYMGRLIDDLLRLSRVTQHEIIKSQINMKELFNKCLNEADISKYNIIIGDLPPVAGDKSLIEIAINNLINNAIKFSNTQENPTIEISATENENEVIYSIKDNGVGFNMDYADKMFVAFQRLHSSDKFEGTGIGLSIVQRIINKHGGKIWAEGKENEGATFYFSLPKK